MKTFTLSKNVHKVELSSLEIGDYLEVRYYKRRNGDLVA